MKKLLAVLLSIMMLAMPLTSMAENSVWDNAARQETTITIHDLNADLVAALGGDDTTMAAINDLLAALSLTGYQQGDEAGFDLNLSGKSVLGMASLTTAAEENQLMYVSSALLGGVIAVNTPRMTFSSSTRRDCCEQQGRGSHQGKSPPRDDEDVRSERRGDRQGD